MNIASEAVCSNTNKHIALMRENVYNISVADSLAWIEIRKS